MIRFRGYGLAMTEKQQNQSRETGYDNEVSTVTPEDAMQAERQRNEQLEREGRQDADDQAATSNFNAHLDAPETAGLNEDGKPLKSN